MPYSVLSSLLENLCLNSSKYFLSFSNFSPLNFTSNFVYGFNICFGVVSGFNVCFGIMFGFVSGVVFGVLGFNVCFGVLGFNVCFGVVFGFVSGFNVLGFVYFSFFIKSFLDLFS